MQTGDKVKNDVTCCEKWIKDGEKKERTRHN